MSEEQSSEQEIILNTGQRLALNLDAHIVIDAGAGTGKTMTIVQRVIQHYLDQDQRATRILPKPERPRKLPGGTITAPAAEREDLQDWGGLLPAEVVLRHSRSQLHTRCVINNYRKSRDCDPVHSAAQAKKMPIHGLLVKVFRSNS